MKMSKLVRSILLVVVISMLGHTGLFAASAQGASRVFISSIDVDAATFPEVTAKVLVLDAEGKPITGAAANLFSVTENNTPVQFQFSTERSGIRTVLVLDLGKWIKNRSYNDQTIRDAMKETALNFIGAMGENDLAELVVVYDKKPRVVVPFTNNKDTLRDAVYGLNWDNQQSSYVIEGIKTATEELIKADYGAYRNIVVVSAGVMGRDVYNTDEDQIIARLNAEDISVFSIYIPWNADSDYYRYLEQFADETQGQYLVRDLSGSEQAMFGLFEQYRTQYVIRYRSPNGTDTHRTVAIAYQGVSDTQEYTIPDAWIAPANIQIVVNNGEAVWRRAETPEDNAYEIPLTSVPVQVTLDGLGGREIKESHFFVNGEEQNILSPTGNGVFTTTWDISRIVDAGKNQMVVEVVFVDELGVTHQASTVITVDVSPPLSLNPVCNAVSKVPGVGGGLGSFCMKAGLNVTNLILLVAVIVLGVLLWTKREQVSQLSQEAVVRTTNMIKRVTQRLINQKPKAKLIARQGLPENAVRTEFDIFGETKIGRSSEFARLIFNNDNISRLHCIIHEDLNGGWTIEDQDSANGTYVNGRRIQPFQPVPLPNGARIELAPVEYGGIEFIFKVLARSDGLDAFDTFADDPASGDVRLTNRLNVSRSNGRDINETRNFGDEHFPTDTDLSDLWDDDTPIEPSDPANQRW